MQSVSVQSQVGGVLLRVHFREGDEVTAGQLLFTIDPRPYEAAMRQAEAVLATDPPQESIVFTSMSVLLGSLAVFSVFLALLSHLIYGTTATRFRPFLMMSAKAAATPAGPAPSKAL